MALHVVEDIQPLRTFFVEVLGFEETTYRPSPRGALVIFGMGACRIGYSTADALPELPGLTQNAMVAMEVTDLEGIHRVFSSRSAERIGALTQAPWGQYFDVTDPANTRLRFLKLDAG